MRILLCVLMVAGLVSCSGEPVSKPLSEAGEKVYDLRGVIESRDAGFNTLKIRHEAIPGFMEAMTMDFSVRGAKVSELPADGSAIQAKLHVTERAYWVTAVERTEK